MKTQGLKICSNKGFHLTFENLLTISVQFGSGNYCDNYDKEFALNPKPSESSNAEIAIFDKTGKWQTHLFLPKDRGVDVVGHVGIDEIAEIIYKVKQYKQS